MSPFFITTLISIIIAVLTLGQVSPSVSNAILAKNVEIGVGRESALMQQIVRYKGVEGVFPATVADLTSKGYWRAGDNDNGFGGNYTFTVDSAKGLVTINTTIADASRRAQYLGSYKHIFRPTDAGSGVVATTFVIPSVNSLGSPTPTSANIPVSTTAPDAATNTYWYDTSGASAILKVSNGASWAIASFGSGGLSAPTSSNIVSTVAALPTTATVGDVRYVYDLTSNTLASYVYYNSAWVYSGGGANPDANTYQIKKSLRLRSNATAYLSRTPALAGNPQKWTFSTWVKRGSLSTWQALSGFQQNAVVDELTGFDPAGHLTIRGWPYNVGSGPSYSLITAAVFNDPSAWYHVLFSVDTTQAIASDREKIYVNGVLQAVTGTYVPQNHSFTMFAKSFSTSIGSQLRDGTAAYLFDGYLAESIFIDGQTLDPSNFGKPDAVAGQWVAKQYTGTYGVNGFYLPFNDASSVIALGRDASGNSNAWTPSNVSLTSGATYDSMTDVPLGAGGVTGNGLGNYATLNPLNYEIATSGSTPIGSNSLSDVNLYLPFINGSYYSGFNSTITVSSGKWYVEATTIAGGSGGGGGLTIKTPGSPTSIAFLGSNNYPVGSVIAIAFDCDSGNATMYANGSSVGSATFTPGSLIVVNATVGNAPGLKLNFGQRPFAYAPPAGFKALHTGNLPATAPTTSGTFTGNLSANGPFTWLGGAPEALWINGNPVAFGTQADRLANGFKVRNATSTFNNTGSNTWSATYLNPANNSSFKYQLAK